MSLAFLPGSELTLWEFGALSRSTSQTGSSPRGPGAGGLLGRPLPGSRFAACGSARPSFREEKAQTSEHR